MKSYIFKLAHKLTKQILQAGDNYQVTFGAVLKHLHAVVKRTHKHISKIFNQGFTKITTDFRKWDVNGKQTGGYCLLASNGTHEHNLTKLLNSKIMKKAYYFSYEGKPKSYFANIALFILRDLQA